MWSIALLSALSVLFVYSFGDAVPILKWSTIRCAGVLSLGGLIAWYIRKPDKFEKIFHLAIRLVWPAGLLFFLVNFIPRKYEIYEVATFFTSVTFFILLMTVSLRGNRITDKLFNHKILYFIGKISYGIYVYHGLLRPFLKAYVYDGFISQISNGIISSIIYTILCTVISVSIA